MQFANFLYQSWFINFEPFNGVKPKEWIEGTLNDIIDFYNGYAFKSKELLNQPSKEFDCYHVFKQGHIKRGGGLNTEGTKSWFPKHKCNELEKYILKKGDILMAMTDMKDNVAILGNTAVMGESNKYIVNQRVGLLRAKGTFGIEYPYISLLTNSYEFLKDLRSRANSGVQVNLSSTEIKNSPIIIPSENINIKFNKIVMPIFEKMINNDLENLKFSSLRDELLPKLITGELDVSNISLDI